MVATHSCAWLTHGGGLPPALSERRGLDVPPSLLARANEVIEYPCGAREDCSGSFARASEIDLLISLNYLPEGAEDRRA